MIVGGRKLTFWYFEICQDQCFVYHHSKYQVENGWIHHLDCMNIKIWNLWKTYGFFSDFLSRRVLVLLEAGDRFWLKYILRCKSILFGKHSNIWMKRYVIQKIDMFLPRSTGMQKTLCQCHPPSFIYWSHIIATVITFNPF